MIARILAALSVALLVSGCIPEDTQIVFDQTHSNRWKIEAGQGYAPLRELLEEAGYPVVAWNAPAWATLNGCPTCSPPIAQADVDILFEAMPQVQVKNPITLALIEQWVQAGGVLVIVTDHKTFPLYVNVLAARFGAHVSNSASVLGDGVSHCPPGATWCFPGHISFRTSGIPYLMSGGVTHVTTWAGSTVTVSPGWYFQPILTLPTDQAFTLQGTTTPVVGDTMVLISVGYGGVVVASEAAMWTCNDGTGLFTGWCPGTLGDGEWNDEFILNLMALLSAY